VYARRYLYAQCKRWRHEAYGELGRAIHDLGYEISVCSQSAVECKKVNRRFCDSRECFVMIDCNFLVFCLLLRISRSALEDAPAWTRMH
jgi:hypothetical protein